MTAAQQQQAAKNFAAYWKGKGYEKGESQPFWLSLLRDVYGVEHPEQFIQFEEQVHLDHTSFIDGTIPATHVLIEQKGMGKDLNKPIKQSDGALLTPFEQAKRYILELPVSQHPRWVVTCNFSTFYVYDMERPHGEPEIIELANLEKEYYRLQFLVDAGNEHLKREMEVSIAAGEIVGLLYDAFYKQYANPESEHSLKSLNKLCVRLVFCLYAEDAGIFGHHGMFHDYLKGFDTRGLRKGLVDLFRVLDTKPQDRDPYLQDDNPELAAFPYVNGGLFSDENIEIPPFTDEIRNLLLNKASEDFNWSEISPTIFGAVFESTLNPETRRSGGMHYTSIENIHKVIDPLFLDELKGELDEICANPVERTRTAKLRVFQRKLASLTFLDPACGSGNFLTETYLSLRRLENKVLVELSHGQVTMYSASESPIQVSISQFYGIEINDFAVTVAKTALWIAESQMMKETEKILLVPLEFLPLKTNAYIVEGNALRVDWESVVSKGNLHYIMGNPPFIGYSLQSKEQKSDILSINNKKRWCLWLVGVSPATLSQMPLVMKRIKQCQQDRLSGADDRKKLADTPWLFRETNVPETAIVVPRHSTKDRKYIPFGFIGREMILTDAAMCIPNAGIYEFGILESNVHMAWMRAIGGRIKSDYRYSKDIVYNNFPWPTPNEHQKVRIEQTSQAILDARALYPDSSLADLYDELTMPPELRKAHQANDRAVMDAYGFTKGTAARTSESACVAELMKLYQQKASEPEK